MDFVFGSKYVQFRGICSLQDRIIINTFWVDPHSDLLQNALMKPKKSLSVVKCENPTKHYTHIHSATISYLSEEHTNVIVMPCKKGTFITLKVAPGNRLNLYLKQISISQAYLYISGKRSKSTHTANELFYSTVPAVAFNTSEKAILWTRV